MTVRVNDQAVNLASISKSPISAECPALTPLPEKMTYGQVLQDASMIAKLYNECRLRHSTQSKAIALKENILER